jgi:cobalt/nickel transport system permease protein
MVPDWLLKDESYVPRPGRDIFLDKSIRSMLGVLTRIRSSGEQPRQRIRPTASVKLASTMLLVLLVSLSRGILFLSVAGALLLGVLSVHRGERILAVLRVSLPAAAITSLVLLPSALWGYPWSLLIITMKVFISVSAVLLFAVTTDWGSISRALASLRIPALFILVLDFTIRYVELLGELTLRMLHALVLRSVGKNRNGLSSLSGVAGTLFMKSRQMAEEAYAAMECRCFSGSYRIGRAPRFGLADAIPIVIDCLLLLAFAFMGFSR